MIIITITVPGIITIIKVSIMILIITSAVKVEEEAVAEEEVVVIEEAVEEAVIEEEVVAEVEEMIGMIQIISMTLIISGIIVTVISIPMWKYLTMRMKNYLLEELVMKQLRTILEKLLVNMVILLR
jgi:hypothetical protein